MVLNPAWWTWVEGSLVGDVFGNFGTMGIPAASNNPPAEYQPATWTDSKCGSLAVLEALQEQFLRFLIVTVPYGNMILLQTTTYCVAVTDNDGCRDTACVTITVEIPCPSDANLEIVPNAFSPNGNNTNDEFCLQG